MGRGDAQRDALAAKAMDRIQAGENVPEKELAALTSLALHGGRRDRNIAMDALMNHQDNTPESSSGSSLTADEKSKQIGIEAMNARNARIQAFINRHQR